MPSHDAKIMKLVQAQGWSFKRFHLSYDLRMMKDEGCFAKMRGIGNSAQSETAFLCYKSKLPKGWPKTRRHVDPGSPLYSDTLHKVPVCKAADLMQVPVLVKDSWRNAFAVDPEANADEGEASDSGGESPTEKKVSKRNYPKRNSGRALLRQPSAETVSCWPRDNSPALLNLRLSFCLFC